MHLRRSLLVAEYLASVKLSYLPKYSIGCQLGGCYFYRIVLVAKADISARRWDGREGSKSQRTGTEAKADLRAVKAVCSGSPNTNGEFRLKKKCLIGAGILV